MQKLYEVLDMLVCDIKIPDTFFSHKLQGNYKGCMECHIEGDFLLIWIDEDREIIEIIRLGSHSELF